MKTTITMLIAIFMCNAFIYAQNDYVNYQDKVLFVIKKDGNIIKTNHYFGEDKNIETIDLPSKAEASKTLGTIKEDIVTILTFKKNVTIYTLPMLLEKFNIDPTDESLPVFVDGHAIPNPADIVSTGDFIIAIEKVNGQINITTKSPRKPFNRDAKGLRQ